MKTFRELLLEMKQIDFNGLQKMIDALDGVDNAGWTKVSLLLQKGDYKKAGKLLQKMDTAAWDWGDAYIPNAILVKMGFPD